MSLSPLRFVVVGLDHRHIYDLVAGLLEAGLDCAGVWPHGSDARVLEGFFKRFPDLPRVEDRAALIADPSAQLLVTAAIPNQRASLAIQAMRTGKDVMVDKPGVTNFADLAAVEKTVVETGRKFSICFSERFLVPSVGVALQLVRDGAIGRVVQTAGSGPHRLNAAIRPDWFFDPVAAGGILEDIASHQIDQFLVFTGSDDARIVASTVGVFDDPRAPGFENFGEVMLRSDRASGYIRVDWFTPDGMPNWGDGRLFITGTEGSIELRKYLDIEGRPGTDHLFLADINGTRHIDCSDRPWTYFRDVANDIRTRGESAMTQRHVFTVSRLALEAQAKAERITLPGGLPR